MNPLSRSVAAMSVLLACATAAGAAERGVTTADLNLRAAPGTHSEIVGKLPAGARVDIASCEGEWCAVSWQGLSGFANNKYLDMGGKAGHPITAQRPPAYRPVPPRVAQPYGVPPYGAAPPPPTYYRYETYPTYYPRYSTYVPYGYVRPYPVYRAYPYGYYDEPVIVFRFGDRPRRGSRYYAPY